MNNENGTPVNVSQLIGNNYSLMEFWSSLCGPCRRENPNIKEIYDDYKNKGFDFLSHNILLDPEGIIIARNLNGELRNTKSELLDDN